MLEIGADANAGPAADRSVSTTGTPKPADRAPLRRARWFRALLLIPGGMALLLGLNAGLQRLDISAPISSGRIAGAHGTLLVLGFVGTVIALERAVALGRGWAFVSPALLGLGGIALIVPLPSGIGPALLLAGTLVLVALYIPLYQRQHDPSVAIQIVGAAMATGAALLVLREISFPVLLPWMAGFVVLTIVGERLELARIALLAPSAAPLLLTIVGAYSTATVLSLVLPRVGYPLLGASVLALVGWLAKFDIATKTIRSSGLPRFTAACLLAGYAWLAVAGGIWLLSIHAPSGAAYDAVVHAVFLGFTLSMIMAHAPIILPAVLRRALPYTSAFYLPAALLQASLLIRVVIGDGFDSAYARNFGGVLNVVAVLLFILSAVVSSLLKDEKAS